jgi:hypothetical protein
MEADQKEKLSVVENNPAEVTAQTKGGTDGKEVLPNGRV